MTDDVQPASPVISLRKISIRDIAGGLRELKVVGAAGDAKFLRLNEADFNRVADAMSAERVMRTINWDMTATTTVKD